MVIMCASTLKCDSKKIYFPAYLSLFVSFTYSLYLCIFASDGIVSLQLLLICVFAIIILDILSV